MRGFYSPICISCCKDPNREGRQISVLSLQYYTGISFSFNWYLICLILSDDLSVVSLPSAIENRIGSYTLRTWIYCLIQVGKTSHQILPLNYYNKNNSNKNSLKARFSKVKISIFGGTNLLEQYFSTIPTNSRYTSNNPIWQVN